MMNLYETSGTSLFVIREGNVTTRDATNLWKTLDLAPNLWDLDLGLDFYMILGFCLNL
jgi:hypothetical protein